ATTGVHTHATRAHNVPSVARRAPLQHDLALLALDLLEQLGHYGQDLSRGLREHGHALEADHPLDGQHSSVPSLMPTAHAEARGRPGRRFPHEPVPVLEACRQRLVPT